MNARSASAATFVLLLAVAACSTGDRDSTSNAQAEALPQIGAASAGGSTTDMPKDSSNLVSVRVFDSQGVLSDPIAMPRVELTDAQWRERLGPERFKILRASGTERPFCGTLLDNKIDGVYTCGGCGLPLFASDAKFDSGTGWPSFFQPIAPENVAEHEDRSHFMVRTEIECARCGGHLGHVFDDGPRPTGLRFCLNSESLDFTASEDLAELADPAAR
jgi:methionine-R-sulfoxide reductase